MADNNGRANARRRIQALNKELARLEANPMLDPDEHKKKQWQCWEEIKHLDQFLQETKAARKPATAEGGRKRAQRTFAI